MGIRSVACSATLAASVLISGAIALSGCAAGPGIAPAAGPTAGSGDTKGAAGGAARAPKASADPIALLEGFGIAGGSGTADPAAIVAALDELPVSERPTGLTTSITATQLRLQPDTPDEAALALDGEEFYVSVAPYRNETHPCSFHSPTACQGELRGERVDLRVTDAASGEAVLERTTQTADNGFVGLWLPRDGEYEISIASGGDSGSEIVRTGDEDPTCITTLRLR